MRAVHRRAVGYTDSGTVAVVRGAQIAVRLADGAQRFRHRFTQTRGRDAHAVVALVVKVRAVHRRAVGYTASGTVAVVRGAQIVVRLAHRAQRRIGIVHAFTRGRFTVLTTLARRIRVLAHDVVQEHTSAAAVTVVIGTQVGWVLQLARRAQRLRRVRAG